MISMIQHHIIFLAGTCSRKKGCKQEQVRSIGNVCQLLCLWKMLYPLTFHWPLMKICHKSDHPSQSCGQEYSHIITFWFHLHKTKEPKNVSWPWWIWEDVNPVNHSACNNPWSASKSPLAAASASCLPKSQKREKGFFSSSEHPDSPGSSSFTILHHHPVKVPHRNTKHWRLARSVGIYGPGHLFHTLLFQDLLQHVHCILVEPKVWSS